MIEALESRIAPATLVNPTTVTFTDVDGDFVTVKISKGAFNGTIGGAPSSDHFTFVNSGLGQQLQLIDLSGNLQFSKANLTITAQQIGAGDGSVDVGAIDASGVDLGKVLVDGDLGRIEAGDSVAKTPGLLSLTVESMGLQGTSTQAGGGDLISDIRGRIGSITTTASNGDLSDVTINVYGGIYGSIGKIVINDDLDGGANPDSGAIYAQGRIDSILIKDNIFGVLAGVSTAGVQINPDAQIGSVRIGGNWAAGSIAAGTNPNITFYADGSDIKISVPGRDTATVSKIASIIIGGTIAGSAGGGDNFGFIAQHLVSIKVNGTPIATLTRGAGNDTTATLVAPTTDFRYRELPIP